MGRFERKIRKKIQEGQPDFDVWFEKHKDQFSRFDTNDGIELQNNGTVKKKVIKNWMIPLALVLIGICAFLCFLPSMLNKQPTHFGDEAVYNVQLNDEDISELEKDYQFISKFSNLTGEKILLKEDKSLVFTILDGELETEFDYYLTTIQIEYNSYYDFISKPNYFDLENQLNTNDYTIGYELNCIDIDGLYMYYLLAKNNNQTIYMEIHCFEESITDFIDKIFN